MAPMSDTKTPCRVVTTSEVHSAPVRFVNSVDLPVTPEQLFEVLADEDSWPQWVPAITKVTWTSPKPIRVGTTRTVDMVGGIVGDEEFMDWDPPRTMGFYFTHTTAPGMEAFGEYYDVAPTASGCRLTWTLAMWPTGRQRYVMPVMKPVLNLGFKVILRKLGGYCKRHYSTP